MCRNLLIAALVFGSVAVSSRAATISLSTTYRSDSTGEVIGTGTFTYDAPAILAEGNYNWSSFDNPTITISFTDGAFFNEAHFTGPTTFLGVQIFSNLPNQFHFTANGGFMNGMSADFVNLGNALAHTPNLPNQGWYGDPSGDIYASYFLQSSNFFGPGPYGIVSAPIPEPSTYGLILGGLALAGAAIRRRKSAK